MKSKNQIRDLFSINLTGKIGVQDLPCIRDKLRKGEICQIEKID